MMMIMIDDDDDNDDNYNNKTMDERMEDNGDTHQIIIVIHGFALHRYHH